MFKKLSIGLAPLLVIAAFAVMPVAAQAVTQHWYVNGALSLQGEQVPVVWFGNEIDLSQTDTIGFGEVSCRTVGGGIIENPVGGGAGEGKMFAAAFFECKAPGCEEEILKKLGVPGRGYVEADNMPASINGHTEKRFVPFPGWSMLLEESIVAGVLSVRVKIGEVWGKPETRSPAGMIRVRDECEVAATEQSGGAGPIFEGELKPEIGVAKTGNLNGTSPGAPSQAKFNLASTGELHSAGVPGTATYMGNLKYLGYFHQEVITVKP
jgi:hypothetical protein